METVMRYMACLALAACAPAAPRPDAAGAIERGRAWIQKQERPDGSFGSGVALTALAAWAIGPDERTASFLRQSVDSAGAAGRLAGGGYDFPNYTTALVILAGLGTRRNRDYLRSAQLVEALGYKPAQPQFGGWDFGVPQRNGTWVRCDLSVTAFVLDALGQASEGAASYVDRCRDPETGGFFFCPWGSKAGYRALPDGRYIPRAYGSMTCDGLRALLACGAAPSDERVTAGLDWLKRRWSLERNPGFDESTDEQREYERATLFYYFQSVARTLAILDPHGDWPGPLIEAVLKLQRADGSWMNPHGNEYTREQEPLIATSFALAALKAALACLK